mmetsp:Transcript_21657/g.49317  ORF Transcript_21657/g.49317 Transcript_21657/m.49317 type:complete len:261 (+) Transcript_21657:32-814(+)
MPTCTDSLVCRPSRHPCTPCWVGCATCGGLHTSPRLHCGTDCRQCRPTTHPSSEPSAADTGNGRALHRGPCQVAVLSGAACCRCCCLFAGWSFPCSASHGSCQLASHPSSDHHSDHQTLAALLPNPGAWLPLVAWLRCPPHHQQCDTCHRRCKPIYPLSTPCGRCASSCCEAHKRHSPLVWYLCQVHGRSSRPEQQCCRGLHPQNPLLAQPLAGISSMCWAVDDPAAVDGGCLQATACPLRRAALEQVGRRRSPSRSGTL